MNTAAHSSSNTA